MSLTRNTLAAALCAVAVTLALAACGRDEPDLETGKAELYNLKDDLGEKTDLAAKMPEKAKELREMLAAWRTHVKAPMPQRR